LETLGPSDRALRKCRDCKHEVINRYKEDGQGNTMRLPENCKHLISESDLCLEPTAVGISCDAVSQDYRGVLKDHLFNGCPFFEKK
jgi:hypothetical protein